MQSTASLLVGSLLLSLSVGTAVPMASDALAACSAIDVINNTTAADAARAMERAGYTDVHVYAKGCDNSWHAHAMLNGNPVNVVWNGEGQVVTEGD